MADYSAAASHAHSPGKQEEPDVAMRTPMAAMAQASEVAGEHDLTSELGKVAPEREAAAAQSRELSKPKGPAGFYPEIGQVDETGGLPKLPAGNRGQAPTEVVLHQTATPSYDSTISAYKRRENNVGAHYLVGKDGKTGLTVPTDKKVWHSRKHNTKAVGIEMVGQPTAVDMKGSTRGNSKALRAQVAKLDLAPKFKASLLAMDDKALYAEVSGSSQPRGKSKQRNIYTDISGDQKQALWSTSKELAKDYNLDVGDFKAHSEVNAKSLGEGVNGKEFLQTMNTYQTRVSALEQAAAKLASPNPAVSQTLKSARATLAALRAPNEKNAAVRDAFFNDFYNRSQAIDQMMKGLGS